MLKNMRQKERFVLFLCVMMTVVVSVLFVVISMRAFEEARRLENQDRIDTIMTPQPLIDSVEDCSKDAVRVLTGVNLNNIFALSMKDSTYTAVYQVWFRWSGSPDLDIANHFSVKGGTLGERVVLKNTTVGNETYQLVSCKITTVIVYNDIRYPLDNHLVGCYFVPDYDVEEVMFVADKANSGYDQGLNVPGYSVEDSYAGIVYFQNTNSQSDPTVTGREIYSTLVTATKLTRSDLTVYLKCFITLYGTLIWMVVTLFVCIYHRVNSLAMISGALFGAVSNILVGTGQLSDSLSVGLLEIVNTYGITIILIGTFTILHINQMRVNNNEINEYEQLFGKAMFAVILICAVTVNILIPYLAYR